MASFAYSAINAQGVELSGEISAADLDAAREQLRVKGLLAQSIKEIADGGRRHRPDLDRRQEGQAEVAPDLLAPVRDDDRGRA